MSYEMKDILKTMIDNNEPHWSADTMDMVRVEIHNAYTQAAKADEYEAKARILDRVKEFATEPPILLAEYQIHIHEQAAKADEYEAKAKAWDKLSVSIRECNKEIELKGGLNAMFRTSKKGQIVQRHIDCFESGEYDA